MADAFQRADADRLAASLSQRLKTYVACTALGVGDGYYGADQMHLLLRRLFRDDARRPLIGVQARPSAELDDVEAVIRVQVLEDV